MLEFIPGNLLEYSIGFLTLYVIVFFLLVFLQNMGKINKEPRPPKVLPKISVLIPAFNEEECIAGTIESVLNAGYPRSKLDIIVINDGSTDNTLKIARKYGKNKVRVINKENSGKAASLNAGIAVAKGELIATLDADSYIEKGSIQKMLGYFADPKVAAVTSVMKVHDPRNVLQRLQGIEYLVTVFSRKILSYLNSINVTPGPLSIIRKRIFKEIGGYEETNLLEDQEMAMRIQSYNYKIESSMSAVVYTEAPSTLRSLVNQRVRWHRGGIRNILKHHYLVSPKYGDFGMFVMPVAILSTLLVFAVFLIAIFSLLTNNSLLDLFTHGFDALFFSFTGLQALGTLIMITTIAWAVLGIKYIQRERISAPFLLLYIIIYAPLITLFWLATAFKEIKRERLRW
ncbi:MAG: glycosyltransferase [Candidatus Micrarchaeota archaeon]